MNWLDLCIIGVLLISTVAALGRGIVIELLSLLGLIMGVILAGRYYSKLAVDLLWWVKVQAIASMAAFLLIIVMSLLVMTVIGHVLHKLAKYAGMGWLDSLLGAVFGLVRGAVAVTAAMMALAAFWPLTTWTHDSRLAPYFIDSVQVAAKLTPPALRDKIDNGLWTLRQLTNHKGWQ